MREHDEQRVVHAHGPDLGWPGVVVDTLTREQAAACILEHPVLVQWRPLIVVDRPEWGEHGRDR